MNIKRLKSIEENPTPKWGHNGYVTNFIFKFSANETENRVTLDLYKTESAFSKTWVTTTKDIMEYNHFVKAGFSFGAFEKEVWVGWVICEPLLWNNSLLIHNILVSQEYRGRGVGKKLIERVKRESHVHQIRLIEVETQNTNVPAIQFYRKRGFAVTGLNMKLYDGPDKDEIAIFMTHENSFVTTKSR